MATFEGTRPEGAPPEARLRAVVLGWEYKEVVVRSGYAMPEAQLCKLGAAGWELITAVSGYAGLSYYFKRALPAVTGEVHG